METYKIIVEYDGTRYRGFKSGKKGSTATILEKIEAVLARMENGEDFVLAAAVNTEAGVHSMGQTISYKTHKHVTATKVQQYLNQYLPLDIVVREVCMEREGFHAEVGKRALCYQYRIQTGSYQKVLEQAYMQYEPEGLNLSKIEEGMKLLLTTRDFVAFKNNKRIKKSSQRTIENLRLKVDQEEIILECIIDDVWPGLMPALFGVLLQLGKETVSLLKVKEELDNKQVGTLNFLAPTKGLILQQVYYDA